PSVRDGGSSGLISPNGVDPGGTVWLFPGVYQSITVTGGRVNFSPGIYLLSPSNGPPYALDVTGGTVTGAGVMFYNTVSDFVPSTGSPASNDAAASAPGPSAVTAPAATADFQGRFAGIRLDTSNQNTISLSAIGSDGGPFNGTLIYQRRANRQA